MDLAQIAGFESGDVSNVISVINGEDFRVLGANNANAFLIQIGVDQVVELGGDKIGGFLSAVEGDQIQALGADQVLQGAVAMHGEHFQLLDPDSSLPMSNIIGLDQSLGLQSDQLSGMFGAMDPTQYEEVGGDQLVQVVGNITKDDLGGCNSDQALGIATNLDTGDLQNQGDAGWRDLWRRSRRYHNRLRPGTRQGRPYRVWGCFLPRRCVRFPKHCRRRDGVRPARCRHP